MVEDSPDDAFFMRYALKKAGFSGPIQVAITGQEAIEYLGGTGKYTDRGAAAPPTVVFLDLKLPCMDGFEVLAWIRQHANLNQLPVFVLTGSSEDRDKARAAELGAKGYYVKPPEAATLLQVLQMLQTDAGASLPV